MSTPPIDNSNTLPSVQKSTRRFAPTIRGRGRGGARGSDRGASGASDAGSSSASTPSATAGSSSASPSVKIEQGSSIGHLQSDAPSDGRLLSVHGPKTRGGAAKMKFKPTIPARRNKKEVTASALDQVIKNEGHDRHGGDRGGRGGRGRGRGARGGRGRGRGRGRGLVVEEVTASGIFSLGPSAAASRSRSAMMASTGAYANYGGDVDSSRYDENGADTDMSVLFSSVADTTTPVVVPHVARTAGELEPSDLTRSGHKIPWLRTKKDSNSMDVDTKAEVKLEAMEDGPTSDAGADAAVSAPPQELWEMDDDAPAQNIFGVNENNKVVSVADDELLLFQLPSVVPNFERSSKRKLKEEQVEEGADKGKAPEKSLPTAAQKATLEEQMSKMSLADMPSGRVGKLVVFKSGKIKLKLGNILFDLDTGMASSFLENVMVVDTESGQGKKAIELGHLVQKFTCVPNMNALLQDQE
ncbi:RNA polymerase III RPC4-domain-containing protein [Gongronella butleri]|nr:RNA polymerase III RPC4-domain-containing protein [Gongronella butleri]